MVSFEPVYLHCMLILQICTICVCAAVFNTFFQGTVSIEIVAPRKLLHSSFFTKVRLDHRPYLADTVGGISWDCMMLESNDAQLANRISYKGQELLKTANGCIRKLVDPPQYSQSNHGIVFLRCNSRLNIKPYFSMSVISTWYA